MKYCKKLIGTKCYLSTVSTEDAPQYFQWLNDAEVAISLRAFTTLLSLEVEKDFISSLAKGQTGDHVFAIVDHATDQLLGNCGLVNINFINRNAELGIFIGDKSYWGKGYGEEAIRLLLDHAFNVLNLNSVYLSFYGFNERVKRLYEKCGFKVNGLRREARIIGNAKFDEYFMDILSSEYKSIYLQKVLDQKISN